MYCYILSPKAQYIVNAKGKPTSVLISKKEFDNLLEYIEELEELADIAAYKSAVSEKNKSIPWELVKRS